MKKQLKGQVISCVFVFCSCHNQLHKSTIRVAATFKIARNSLRDNYTLKTFEISCDGQPCGWGYDIFTGSRKLIHQPFIPAMPGSFNFKTKEDAQKTGQLVLMKLNADGFIPSVSIAELDSLGVH
jgi:hypothetical protein